MLLQTVTLQGEHTVIVAGDRRLEYWTACDECAERDDCKHDCDHPGWIRFLLGGVRKVYWSGKITQRKIEAVRREYLEGELPADVRPCEWEQLCLT